MKSITGRSSLAAAALCAFALAACDSVKDVRTEPTIAGPTPTAVLQGQVTGLGYRRPVVLEDRGAARCADDNSAAIYCSEFFFGNFDNPESTFTFGAVEVGTPYDVTVKTQPYGKICSVTGGSGVIDEGGVDISVVCVPDPAVQRYAISGTVAPAVASLPGAKVILTTEEGVREMSVEGLTSFTFDDAVFDNALSLPIFLYSVTATFEENGTVNNCAVTNGSNRIVEAAPVAPTADVTNVAVTACEFPVSGAVAYSVHPGGTAQAMGAGGLTLAMRDIAGNDVQSVQVDAFGNYSFPELMRSHPGAYYQLVVTSHPAGQRCVPGYGRTGSPTNPTTPATAGLWQLAPIMDPPAVMLIDPLNPEWWLIASRNVYCRALPAAENVLTGTYQQATVAAATTTNRNFMTFFADGTFLYGIHMPNVLNAATFSLVPVNGVEHGFYHYDSLAQSINFTVYTDTAPTNGSTDLTDMPAPSSGGGNGTFFNPFVMHPTATNVVRTQGPGAMIELTFGPGSAAPVNWTLTEVVSSSGLMTGAWARPDNRAVWVYDFATTFGFYAGVVGIPNVSDACYVLNDGTDDPSGYYTRRGGRFASNSGNSDCMADLPVAPYPEYNTPGLSSLPPGFNGMFPGSHHLEARSPSEINYEVTPGTPDTLTVQETLNGTPNAPAITLVRISAD